MKDIFDSADWARTALAKKEAEAYRPKLERFQCASRAWFEIKAGAVFELEERPGEGELVLGTKP